MLLGTALLAYGFSLRHAVDTDHIAAWIASVVINCNRDFDNLEVRPAKG